MKKTIIALVCIGMAVSAFAQSSVNTVDQKHYNKIYFSYSPLAMKMGIVDASLANVNTFALNYMYGIAVANVPLYVEFGAGLQYANFRGSFGSNPSNGSYNGPKTNIFSLDVPVNFAYRLSFNGGKCHLTPYTGFYARVNLSGKTKYEGVTSDDFFGSDGNGKRFQLGWQAGLTFDISKFYLQMGYRTDVSTVLKYGEDAKMAGFNLGIGVIF